MTLNWASCVRALHLTFTYGQRPLKVLAENMPRCMVTVRSIYQHYARGGVAWNNRVDYKFSFLDVHASINFNYGINTLTISVQYINYYHSFISLRKKDLLLTFTDSFFFCFSFSIISLFLHVHD